MRAQFVRGGLNTRKEVLDRVLNRIITLEMLCANVSLTPNKDFNLEDEDTKFFLEELKKAEVEYKITGEDHHAVLVTISGPKEAWLKILPLWDAYSRDPEDLAEALEDWQGDENELLDVIT